MGIIGNISGLFRLEKTMNLGVNATNTPQMSFDETIQKSERVRDSRAIVEDPLSFVGSFDYKDKPFSLTYDLLKRMAENSVIASIVNTRVNQVSTFTQPARYTKDGIGFEISLRNPKAKPTKEQSDMMLSIEAFIENCGFKYDPGRDSFDDLIRKIVRDSLIYDQMCFEIVPDRFGRPAEILAVDASTIRAASVAPLMGTDGIVATQLFGNDDVKWVQILQGKPVADFTGSELAFGVRNPRTDVNMQPYGYSELEILVKQVTSHLWAEEYNSRYFSQGGTTKGILNLKGQNINKEQLDAFRRQWTAQIAGVTGAWKTPVVSVDGMEYINVSQSNREMEYEMWMNYLINICCAVYQIDPAEINFPNRGGSAGRSGGLGEGGIEDRLKNSRDKGLRPLLRFISSVINRHIIRRFGNDYTFNFVGLDPETEADRQSTIDRSIKTYKTVNEIRKDKDLEPIEGGDIILDPTYTNYLLQVQQQEQMEQAQQGSEGDEGQEEVDENGNPLVSYDGQDEQPPEQNSEDVLKEQEDSQISQGIDESY